MNETCFYCQLPKDDMRPYGPGAAKVCFECVTSDPSREDAAKDQFRAQLYESFNTLDTTGKSVVVLDTDTGKMTAYTEDELAVWLDEMIAKEAEEIVAELAGVPVEDLDKYGGMPSESKE